MMKVERPDGRGCLLGFPQLRGEQTLPSAGDIGGGPGTQKDLARGRVRSMVSIERETSPAFLPEHVSLLRGKKAAEPGEMEQSRGPR